MGSCTSSHCTWIHATFNRAATETCNAHITPGMWCEKAYEIGGTGCPFSHPPPAYNHQSTEGARDSWAMGSNGGKGGKGSHRSYSPNKRRNDGPPAGSGDCWYFTQPGGCKKGDACDRPHGPKNGIGA